jgi:hypothetical protein
MAPSAPPSAPAPAPAPKAPPGTGVTPYGRATMGLEIFQRKEYGEKILFSNKSYRVPYGRGG